MRCIRDLVIHCLWGVLAGNTLSGAFDLYGFQATIGYTPFFVQFDS